MKVVIDLGELEDMAKKLEAFSRLLSSKVGEAKQQAGAGKHFPGPRVRTNLFDEELGPSVGSIWLQVGFEKMPMVVVSVEHGTIRYEDEGWDNLSEFKQNVQSGKYYLIGCKPLAEKAEEPKENAETSQVIVVNDCDGHAYAVKKTCNNLKRLLDALLEANKHNTMLDDEEAGYELLKKEDVTLEELESYLWENAPMDRSGGRRIYIVDLQGDNFKFDSSMFE